MWNTDRMAAGCWAGTEWGIESNGVAAWYGTGEGDGEGKGSGKDEELAVTADFSLPSLSFSFSFSDVRVKAKAEAEAVDWGRTAPRTCGCSSSTNSRTCAISRGCLAL